MADSSWTQSSFLGGRFSPAASARIDLPVYSTSLAESLNGLPMEEGCWIRRSGTWRIGPITGGDGIIETFELPNNRKAILEFTNALLRIWVPNDIVGTGFGYTVSATTFSHDWTTPAQLQAIRVIQTDDVAYILGPSSQLILYCTNYSSVTAGTQPIFTSSENFLNGFTDGPYLDPFPGLSQTNNSLGAVDGNSTTPVFTISDGAYTFVAGDVGRSFRIWSQPPAWSGSTTYSAGAYVTYQGTFWQNLVAGASTVGIPPGAVSRPSSGTVAPTQVWSLVPAAGEWAYGSITTFTSGSQVTVTLQSPNTVPTTQNGLVIDTWQIGLYHGTIQPSCGTFHEGRLWLGGAVPNRFDACVTNTVDRIIETIPTPSFSPTDVNGNVFDNSAISYTVNSAGSNQFLWMSPDHMGILAGTASGEWLIQASALNDPLTPTSAQAHRSSGLKAANSEPVRMGISLAFIQSFKRRLLEYTVDVFSGQFIGRNLNEYAKDISTSGFKRLAYQEELAPVIWGVTNGGTLLGCTYRRVSRFGQEAPVFMGWHQHAVGSPGTVVRWVCLGSNAAGTEDVLMLYMKDAAGNYRLELMRPIFDANQALWNGWYLDDAMAGTDGLTAVLTGANIVISGATGYENATVNVFLAGLSCGAFPVSGSGVITVPLGSDPDGALTKGYLEQYQGSFGGYSFVEQALVITGVGTVPCIIGYPFTSTLTTQRPQTVDQTRAQTGPSPGKTRRLTAIALHLVNTITGADISIDDSPARTLDLYATDRQTKIDHQTLFKGVYYQEVEDDHNFDGQITISTNSVYPMTVGSITSFLNTQDR